MSEVRLLVCGGGQFVFPQHVDEALDTIHGRVGIDLLIESERSFARSWGARNSIVVETYEANRKIFMERAAGIRNASMIKLGKPNAALVFPVDEEAVDLITKLIEAGVPAVVGCWAAGPGSTLNWKRF